MDIQGIHLAQWAGNAPSGAFQEGQRLWVEIVQLDSAGQGKMKINGQLFEARLETTARPGETFWAVVEKATAQELLLAREVTSTVSTQAVVSQKPIHQQRVQEGPSWSTWPVLNQDFAQAIQTVKSQSWLALMGMEKSADSDNPAAASREGPGPSAAPGLASLLPLSLRETLLTIFPQWSEMNGDTGPARIRNFFSTLGIGYERKLAELLLATDKPPAEQLTRLADTIKAQLLRTMQEQDPSSTGSRVHGLLNKITGQQLFFGTLDPSYLWLNLPLWDNDRRLRDVKIAFQSSREKKALDPARCRIGVYIETPALGPIGIDGYLAENSLSIQVLSTTPREIKDLIQQLQANTIARFAQFGLKLTKIDVAPWDSHSEFGHFIAGEPREGVDVYA